MWVLCGIHLGGCAIPKFNVSCSVVDTEETTSNEEKKKTVLDKCKENPEFKISVPF